MHESKVKRLKTYAERLSVKFREEIVSQLHELAGRIVLDDKERVLQIIQALDKVFETVE